jgi:hypothetical protein
MDKQLPTYLLIIDDSLSSDLQVDMVSLVDSPAIEKNFLAFGKELKFALNADKQEIFGPAMLADVPIYRRDEQLGEYNVVFDKATIYAIAQKFFEKGFSQNFNLMHDASQKCEGVYVFQSYIVDSSEGRPAPKGFEDSKDGSWFLGVKVNNPEVWAKVKTGDIKGFSVEGVFEYKKKPLTDDQVYSEIHRLLSMVSF